MSQVQFRTLKVVKRKSGSPHFQTQSSVELLLSDHQSTCCELNPVFLHFRRVKCRLTRIATAKSELEMQVKHIHGIDDEPIVWFIINIVRHYWLFYWMRSHLTSGCHLPLVPEASWLFHQTAVWRCLLRGKTRFIGLARLDAQSTVNVTHCSCTPCEAAGWWSSPVWWLRRKCRIAAPANSAFDRWSSTLSKSHRTQWNESRNK